MICLKHGVQTLLQTGPLWLGLNEFPMALPFPSVGNVLESQPWFGCHLHRKAKKHQSSDKPQTFLGTTTCWTAKPVLWGPAMMQISSGGKKKSDNQSSFPNPSIFNRAFCKSWPWCDQLNHCLVRTGTQRCCFHDKVSLSWQCSQNNLSFLKLTFQCWKS